VIESPLGQLFGGDEFGGDDPLAIFDTDKGREIVAVMERINGAVAEFGIGFAEASTLSDEQIEITRDVIAGVGEAFEDAKISAHEALDDIAEGLLAQNPLLDIYSGKITQSFAEWRKGQQDFRTDVEAVTGLRETLIANDLPGALVNAFDRAPIEKQAWLAALGESQLEEALEEMSATFELLDENARIRQVQSFTDVMNDVGAELAVKGVELGEIAAEQGAVSSALFDTAFDEGAAEWAVTTQNWYNEIARIISEPLAGPVIGSPQFSADGDPFPGGVTYTITINNPQTNDLPRDMETAVDIAVTNDLIN